MIKGVHAIMFGENADAIRDFLRDVVDLDYVEAGGGWPIFQLPPSELEAKGVEFTAPVRDQGWGLVTAMQVPGGGELGLYQPLHATAV
jgi:hypothetical protein